MHELLDRIPASFTAEATLDGLRVTLPAREWEPSWRSRLIQLGGLALAVGVFLDPKAFGQPVFDLLKAAVLALPSIAPELSASVSALIIEHPFVVVFVPVVFVVVLFELAVRLVFHPGVVVSWLGWGGRKAPYAIHVRPYDVELDGDVLHLSDIVDPQAVVDRMKPLRTLSPSESAWLEALLRAACRDLGSAASVPRELHGLRHAH